MMERISPDAIYASILMLRTVGTQPVLLVEGANEVRVFSTHLDKSALTLVDCHGCENLMRVAAIALQKSDSDVFAIRDRDWLDLENGPLPENVVLTELYDLDSTLFFETTAGARVVSMFADQQRQEQHCARLSKLPIELVEEVCSTVGTLRLASFVGALGLRTEGLPFNELLQPDLVDVDRLIELTIIRTSECLHSSAIVREHFDRSALLSISRRRRCSGHDLGGALSFLFLKRWGGSNNSAGFVLNSIRSAVHLTEFKSLDVVKALITWFSNVRPNQSLWPAADVI